MFKSRDEKLFDAIDKEDINEMAKQIKNGANIQAAIKDTIGKTPLILAVYRGKVSAASALLSWGAKVDARDHYDNTALYYARNKIDMRNLLLKYKADINAKYKDGDTLLHRLQEMNEIRFLLENKADVNVRNNAGETPLFKSDVVKARLLLDQGADVNAKDNEGYTVLHKLIKNHPKEVNDLMRLLVARGAEVNTQNNQKTTLMHDALVCGWEYDYLNSERTQYEYTESCAIEVIEWLLANKAQLNVKDIDSNTPLHTLISRIHHAEAVNEFKKFGLLLAHGADLTAKNDIGIGKTPLELAYDEEIRKLLEEQAQQIKQPVAIQPSTFLTAFQSFLNDPEQFSFKNLSHMFKEATDLYSFRLPYTVALLFRELKPYKKKKVDALVQAELKQLAENNMVSSECVALFKIILRSAFQKGVIDRNQKYTLDNIAEKAAIFADERFQTIKNQVAKLQLDVSQLQENVQVLAGELNQLKSAIKRKAQRDMLFSVAKIALAFIGSQAVDMLAAIADFSDFIELSTVIFQQLSFEDVGKKLIAGQKIVLELATDQVLQKAGWHPEAFIEVWSQTALALQTPASPSPGVELPPPPVEDSPKPTSPTIVKFNRNRFFSPPSSPVLPTVASPQDTFVQWLNEAKRQGQFTLAMNGKALNITFTSQNNSPEEIETRLFALDDHLKALPELQSIKLDDCDMDENTLIITTKTTLDAKKLNNVLQKNYAIEAPGVKSSLSLVKS